MTKLKYTLKNDTLFKMMFVKYPDLLKRLVVELLSINYNDIEQFYITNPEMPPESIDNKFCNLDINMIVDGQRVDLEIQVNNEGDYPIRTLFYWARNFSTTIGEGDNYSQLPRTVLISIVNFSLFKCIEFHSEYQVLEITRQTLLSDKLSLHYFELPKLPKKLNTTYGKELWLNLFKVDTEEELSKIEAMEVPIMNQAIGAYRQVSASPEFREIERLRSKARHDEAQALKKARLDGEEFGEQRSNKKWEGVIAEKDAAITSKEAEITKKDAAIADKDTAIADKEAVIADKEAVIAEKEAVIAEKEAIIIELLAQINRESNN